MLILASASPRRAALLKAHRIKFRVIRPDITENSSFQKPSEIVQELALRKARFVADQLKKGIVLGADTLVEVRGRIVGKPQDHLHALEMLRLLNGTDNVVYTGVALVDAATKESVSGYEKSKVIMRKLSEQELIDLSHKHLIKPAPTRCRKKTTPS